MPKCASSTDGEKPVRKLGRKWPGTYFLAPPNCRGVIGLIKQNVSAVDVNNRTRLSVSHPLSHPSSYDLSPNGQEMVVKSTSGRIVVIDPASGAILRDYQNQKEGEGSNPCFSLGGEYIVDGSWNGILSIRGRLDTAITYREEYGQEMISAISHDRDRQVWLIFHKVKSSNYNHPHCGGYVSLRRWPLQTSTPQVFGFGMSIAHARLSPDASRVAFYGTDHKTDHLQRIYIGSISNGRILAQSSPVAFSGTGYELVWSDDCNRLIAVAERRFVLFRTDTLEEVGDIPSRYPACAMFMNNDEKVLLGDWQTTTLVDTTDFAASSSGL